MSAKSRQNFQTEIPHLSVIKFLKVETTVKLFFDKPILAPISTEHFLA